jgi:two-component system copper resistance phosphate regulon response regulator CusR
MKQRISEAEYINALAIVNQYKAENGNILEVGDITINYDKKEVTRQGKQIILTSKEYGLLIALVENRHKVLSRKDLMLLVWYVDFDMGTNTVEVYISFLRQKIDKPFTTKVICTKQGYYFKPNLI